ncbi:MAG: CNNM domain-containing protein [Holosporales bacterium]|jgi:Mg2+/Co2+ transporter CorB|nr:CNNM domain-containing protein [Holosporales bacterium]
MLILLFVVLGLLAVSAYCSSCETALSVSSKAKLHVLAQKGSKKARIAEDLKNNISPMISSILALNTALNAVATSLFSAWLGEDGVALASAVMTILILIYGEILPKMLALWAPESLLLKSAYIMRGLFAIMRHVTTVATWIARKTLSCVGIKLHDRGTGADVEELLGVIDLHRGPDQDAGQERAMLKSILDLRSVQVSEIMTHRKNVTMLNADDSVESIVDQALLSPFSRLPLWQGNLDNIIGVVNVKALLRAVRADKLDSLNIKAIATKPWFIPESTDLLEQLQNFRKRREHFASVVDEYGALMGVVTLEDILEEIVGNIDDEHDIISTDGITIQPDNSVIVDGSITIRDLNRQLDWNLADKVASTVAGFLINTVRMIPNVGQVFILQGFRFTVLKKQRNQITLIRISKCNDAAGEDGEDDDSR